MDAKWIVEHTHGEGSAHLFKIEDFILSIKSDFQTIDIVKLYQFGKSLFLDAKLQSSEADEHVYHETLVHPAMLTHDNPKSVLIIGGGEGLTLREVLKHNCVEAVKMVELDRKLTEICNLHFSEWHQDSFKNSKAEIIFGDGRVYLEKTQEKFDVIISDLTAPTAGAYLLFTKQFFQLALSRLTKGGVLSLQADSTNCTDYKIFAAIHNTISKIFTTVRTAHTYIPSYDTSWGFIIASEECDPILLEKSEIKNRMQERGLETRFYDEELHSSLFVLPKDIRQALKSEKRVFDDKEPLNET